MFLPLLSSEEVLSNMFKLVTWSNLVCVFQVSQVCVCARETVGSVEILHQILSFGL